MVCPTAHFGSGPWQGLPPPPNPRFCVTLQLRGLCGVIFTGLVTLPVQLLQNLNTRVLPQGGPSPAGSAPPNPICCRSSFLCQCCNRSKEANSSKVSNMKYNSSRLILIFQIKRGKRLLAFSSQIFIKMWSRTSLGVQWLGL